MQLFYNLSDPAMEDSLCEINSMCNFARLTLNGPIPDEITILNFRHFWS
nr:transposase [Microbulbifer variabilis]